MAEHSKCEETAVKPLLVPEIVALPAEIDIINGLAIGDELIAAFRPGVSVVIADMSATQYCDSTALRQLIIVNNHAVCIGAELRVVVSSPAVRRIIHVIGADQMLQVYLDMAAALTGAPQVSEQLDEAQG